MRVRGCVSHFGRGDSDRPQLAKTSSCWYGYEECWLSLLLASEATRWVAFSIDRSEWEAGSIAFQVWSWCCSRMAIDEARARAPASAGGGGEGGVRLRGPAATVAGVVSGRSIGVGRGAVVGSRRVGHVWGSSGPAGAFVGEGGWRWCLWLVRGAGTAHDDGIGGWVDGSERRPDDRSFGSGRRNGRVVEACVGQVPCPALGVEGGVGGRRVGAVLGLFYYAM